ncbi:FKBP-type peptidyl-prolyl cis-trans isomerase [Geomonas sp. Red32]|uniref:FKBP-type peptidyl-prolyl cis-trans isomerase n=1 Tax=Geomonas sp. Red32 TaxID=2912856 RepID=UPI00202CEBDB|nr:FKBP-type peptidyl-prolyl cis-trans isomerase [Geomonas sp. Red32]MCM0083155.1 FKBP-type peptidyl-prolyl cis-trans isomerase [Geomonas sp. Red32]
MRTLLFAVLVILIAVPAFASDDLKTEDDKTLYAIGLVMARQVSVLNPTPDELETIIRGLRDGNSGKKTLVDLENYKGKIEHFASERRDARGARLAAQAKSYLDKAAQEKGAVKTTSGLVYIPTQEGTGASPVAADKVKVNYRGTLIDGKEFDSSYLLGHPVEFELNKVIKCWTEGVQMMKAGGKAKLVCPPELAYGERGNGLIPPNSTLVFDIELLGVEKK